MAKYPKVTDELCMRCIYGYPCEMWDEREVPEEGEECPNFIAKCETEQERDQRIMNGGATIGDALSWFKSQAQVVATPTTLATMLARKVIETLEQANKRIWHTFDEKPDLSNSVLLYDPNGNFMSPPVRCALGFDDWFISTMNKKYGANYQMWAYMDDIKPKIEQCAKSKAIIEQIEQENKNLRDDLKRICEGKLITVEQIKSVYAAAGICDQMHEKTDSDNLMALWATLKQWHKELTGGDV